MREDRNEGRRVVRATDRRTEMRKKAARRRRAKSLIIAVMMILAFCSGFFGHTLLSAHAEEKAAKSLNKYYTSIQLRQGDNLWDIAKTYAKGSEYTVSEYVEELKRMNGLKGEQIHSGEFLTVMYFAE